MKQAFKTILEGIKLKIDNIIANIPKKLSELENDLPVVQSDWNQTDETANDYIKNKTHYTEIVRETILSETTLEFTQTGYSGALNVDIISLVDGESYTVIWDNYEYECICHSLSGEAIGDVSILTGSIENDFNPDAPFFIWSSGTVLAKEVGVHTFKIEKKKISIHKIDKKYLPDDIEQVQSDWNQNDENADDYIKNRPFGEEIGKIYLIEEQTVTLDSNGRGNCILIDNFGDYAFVGTTYEIEFDGEVYTGTMYEDGDACMHTDFTTSSGVEVYMYDGSGIASSSALAGDHTIKLSVIGENVTQIDDKYINFPVKSVNGKTGIVWLNPNDIGAANINDLELKIDKENPVGTGSFSLNRKARSTIGQYSFAEGYNTTASGKNAHAEGEITKASSSNSHAEGYNTEASGYASHAEGDRTKASFSNSHAEGYNTEASGHTSHAEGYKTKSSGMGAHAEGYVPDGGTGETITVDGKSYNKFTLLAEGTGSHAEGCATIAYGDYSHTQGQYTFAYGECSNVQGKYNIIDTENKYAHIVGNGNTSTATRSNAHTLDWDGNAWYQGTVKLGGTSYNDASEVALKSDVENKKNKDIVLTLSWTTAEDGTRTYSVDKTFEEIKEAYNSGTSLYVNASDVKFECTKVSNTTAWFDYYLPLGMIEHNILVKSDNTVTWTSKTRSAQASICGGVKADKKSDTDTVPAKIGEDGKLYVPTYPTLDGLATEEYVDNAVANVGSGSGSCFDIIINYDKTNNSAELTVGNYNTIMEKFNNNIPIIAMIYLYQSTNKMYYDYPKYIEVRADFISIYNSIADIDFQIFPDNHININYIG